ncbi:MAG: M3 family metallopeptidase, partial [Holophagales bacterium]|nr:M3 family metallopeptidase [Holophagales bacterium]
FDLDADSTIHLNTPDTAHTRVCASSMMRYGPRIATPRIVEVMRRYGLRQTFFVRFEVAAHDAIMANKSAEDLYELYEANLRQQFGPDMDIAPEFRFEWLSIPHIYNTPFYCYSYSFGQLLVLALYRRYQEEGEAFKPGYMRLLSYGGSKSPAEALAELDIDIADPEFWQGGFDVVKGMIDELRSIEIPS